MVDLWLTLDNDAVDKSSKASDKQARELEEERLKAEQELRDSLEQAEAASRNVVLDALQESSQSNETITETDEDEFF